MITKEKINEMFSNYKLENTDSCVLVWHKTLDGLIFGSDSENIKYLFQSFGKTAAAQHRLEELQKEIDFKIEVFRKTEKFPE